MSALNPIYAVLTPAMVLRQEAVARLRAEAVQTAADFNCDEFRAGECDLAAVLRAAHTLPMLAPRRWVHLAAVHLLRAEGLQALAAYVAAPVPTTVLCLSGDRLDQRLKLAQALKKAQALVPVPTPRPHELGRWLQQRAQAEGLQLSGDAAALLVQLVGSDLDLLLQGLEKVRLYAGQDGTRLELEQVGEAVAATRMSTVFELNDAIGARTWGPASLKLRQLLQGGEAALMVLAMISRQLRQLLQLKAAGPADSRRLGVPSFALAGLQAQARRFSEAELVQGLHHAAAADLALKSSRLPAECIMERLLLALM